MACADILFLTIIGADYSKNTKCYKNEKKLHIKCIKIKEKYELCHYLKLV